MAIHLSLKIVLHSKEYSDGTRPVMLQCIATGKPGCNVWKRRTICRVKPAQFDKANGRVNKQHPNFRALNVKISTAYSEAERRLLEAEREGRELDPAMVIAEAEAPILQTGMLLVHAKTYIDKCRQKGQFHTAEKYGGHITRMAEYLGKDATGKQRDILMDKVDEQWLLDWSVWLKSNGTKSANTLHRRMAFITTLFNDARKRRLTTADPMAFLEFKEQRVRKPKLTMEQIRVLEALPLEGKLADARNTFLLQFYAYGTRISDALIWKKADVTGSDLRYTSMKTGDLIDVRLTAKAQAMVDTYMQTVDGPFLLPWLSKFVSLPNLTDEQNRERLIQQIEAKTSMVNALLKAIAEKAGLEGINLTTHIARHTFATLADQVVTDKRKLSAALGHARFSTTEVYLADLRRSDVSDAMEAVWE